MCKHCASLLRETMSRVRNPPPGYAPPPEAVATSLQPAQSPRQIAAATANIELLEAEVATQKRSDTTEACGCV